MGKDSRLARSTRWRRTGLLLLVLLLADAMPVLAAPKTDTVRLNTGDILTGEIKSMERGQLVYSTDTMETVSIKWSRVLRVSSPSWYLVTVEGGAQYYGRLQLADTDGRLRVAILNRYDDLEMADVVRIEPIESRVWDRISVALSFGLSYTKASEVSQLTTDGNMKYKDRRHLIELGGNLIWTDKGDESARSQQFDTALQYQHTITGRLFGAGIISGEGNDGLGLELRVLGGLGMGYRLLEGGASVLVLVGGLSANREWSTGNETPTNNAEGLINSSYSLYFYESPKTDLNVRGTYYQSLDSDRRRADFSTSARRELIPDFFIVLNYYESYDSQPPSAEGDKTDRGVVLQVSWSK
ncbi:MAG TPA: DUF481 domain-containing protein [Candidatus Eisenbacteria bacterium]